MNANLYSLLAAHFPGDPHAPCLILPDGRVWTYGDIDRASARMANMIVALGLKPGDRLAAQVEKTPEALVLYLASLRAGTVFLPLNPAYQRQGYGAEAAGARVRQALTADGMHRVVAHCNPQNTASWRLLERIGFRREGLHRQDIFFRRGAAGEPLWTDTYVYALLAAEVARLP